MFRKLILILILIGVTFGFWLHDLFVTKKNKFIPLPPLFIQPINSLLQMPESTWQNFLQSDSVILRKKFPSAILLHSTNALSAKEYLRKSIQSQKFIHIIINKPGQVYGFFYPEDFVFTAAPPMDEYSIHFAIEGWPEEIIRNQKQISIASKISLALSQRFGIPMTNYNIDNNYGFFTHTQAKKKFGRFITLYPEDGGEKVLSQVLNNNQGIYVSENFWRGRGTIYWTVRKSVAKKSLDDFYQILYPKIQMLVLRNKETQKQVAKHFHYNEQMARELNPRKFKSINTKLKNQKNNKNAKEPEQTVAAAVANQGLWLMPAYTLIGRGTSPRPRAALSFIAQDKNGYLWEKKRQKYYYRIMQKPPSCVVLHFTATHTFDRALYWLERRGLAATFMVDADGQIYQMLDDLQHQAAAAYGTNYRCIQIEIIGLDTDTLLANAHQTRQVAKIVTALSKKFKIPKNNYDIVSRAGIFSHGQAKKKWGHSGWLHGSDFDPGEKYMERIMAMIGGKYFQENQWKNRHSLDWTIWYSTFQP